MIKVGGEVGGAGGAGGLRHDHAAPATSRHRLVKPGGRSHRQMLLFFHDDNDCPAKRLAASRSFEHPLTSKPPPGAAPAAPVPIHRAHEALLARHNAFTATC